MKLDEFGVGRITAQNTTKDVKPGETQRQAAKLGFKLDSEGRPPELHKKARKNSDPNTLFNLGLTESYKDLTPETMEKYIRFYADRHGVDPDTAVKVWKSEGGMNYQSTVKKGNQQKYKGAEDSWGPFQLYRGGGLGNEWEKVYGKDLRTANDPASIQQQIDFAMQNAAKSGWGQWYGAAKVGVKDNDGIPDKPLSTKYRPIEIIPTDGAGVQQKYKPADPQSSTMDKIGNKLSKAWDAAKPQLAKAADKAGDVALDVGTDIAKGAANVAKNVAKGNVNKDSWVYKNLVKPLTQDANENKGAIGVPLSSGTVVNIFPHRPLKVKKSTPGKLRYDEAVSQVDIDQLEKFADKIFGKVGIDVEFTRHFMDRVNDPRNNKPITPAELTRLFKQEQKRWGKQIAQLGPGSEAVMKDLQTDINMPFALQWDSNNNELDLIVKTVMRKQDFKTPDQEFPVGEDLGKLINFGGKAPSAKGHSQQTSKHGRMWVPGTDGARTKHTGTNYKLRPGQTKPNALQRAWNSLLDDIDLNEGVNDPHIFKAIFMAGGPGSGKGFVAKNILGGTGLRVVNSDDMFEYLMKQQDLALEPNVIATPQGQEIRQRAKKLIKSREAQYIDGRIGLIIDGTGKEPELIQRHVDKLKELGYASAMIMVNTSLPVAQQRNQERERTVPPQLVSDMWHKVQDNLMKYQQIFGADRFHIVDNSGGLEDLDRQKNFDKVYNETQRFLNTPPKNKKALEWIQKQKEQNDAKRSAQAQQQSTSSDAGARETN